MCTQGTSESSLKHGYFSSGLLRYEKDKDISLLTFAFLKAFYKVFIISDFKRIRKKEGSNNS